MAGEDAAVGAAPRHVGAGGGSSLFAAAGLESPVSSRARVAGARLPLICPRRSGRRLDGGLLGTRQRRGVVAHEHIHAHAGQ